MFSIFGKKWVCDSCGAQYRKQARYCDNCGLELEVQREHFDAFISYRRVGGGDAASIIQLELEKFGKAAFLDDTHLHLGRYDENCSRRSAGPRHSSSS